PSGPRRTECVPRRLLSALRPRRLSDPVRPSHGSTPGPAESSLAGFALKLVQQLERLARAECVDVERLEALAQRVALFLLGRRGGGEQRQLAEAGGEPAGFGAAFLEFLEHGLGA